MILKQSVVNRRNFAIIRYDSNTGGPSSPPCSGSPHAYDSAIEPVPQSESLVEIGAKVVTGL